MDDTGKLKKSGSLGSVAPAGTDMRSSRTYPAKKKGNTFEKPNDHPKYGVDGLNGQDQRGSKQSYPSKKKGDSFARPSAAGTKSAADGIAVKDGGNYGTKGV